MELKKNVEADLEKRSSVLMTLGLVAGLALTLVSFQWRWYDVKPPEELVYQGDNLEEEEIPVSMEEYIPPEQPKPQEEVVLEIIEDESEEEETLEDNTEEVDESTQVITPMVVEEEEVEEEEIFTFAEQMPEFSGGTEAMYKYMQKNIKYPTIAKESGIDGKVYVKFTVLKNGSISNVEVARGIGGGCDEEAVRVVKSMPKWNPGKQRGKTVPVRFTMPIHFKLQ